ncbi:IS5 family transposase [Streptomyces sp. NPDC088707]|uniref:IS5 family transposase n=1 Tax=Streptomyces sp. NPDC088707 TaxID=3365871 RepID=UPI00382B5BC1
MDHGVVIRRHELSDAEWEFVRPLLPESLRGRKRPEDRRVLNGIVWKFRTGTAWRDVPERYGPWATLHTRFRRWAADGTFDRMLRAGRPCPSTCGGGSKRGLRDPGLGRSRGGLTSKIHLACDGRGRPLSFMVTGGNTNDCTQSTAVMEAIRVPRIGPGRPRVRPDHVLGDKGYSSKAIRAWLRRRGIPHTIPETADQARNLARRGSRGGRPPTFDREAYKHRTVVERCFNRLKQWRGIATR